LQVGVSGSSLSKYVKEKALSATSAKKERRKEDIRHRKEGTVLTYGKKTTRFF